MAKRYTIPAFDPTNSGTRAATAIKIEGAKKLTALRCTGAANVRIHAAIPVDNQDNLDGFPLGANAADNELGECLPADMVSASDQTCYITATAISQVAVYRKS